MFFLTLMHSFTPAIPFLYLRELFTLNIKLRRLSLRKLVFIYFYAQIRFFAHFYFFVHIYFCEHIKPQYFYIIEPILIETENYIFSFASYKKISSIFLSKQCAITKASSKEGLYFPVSIALTVCLETPSFFANIS